MAIAGAGGKTQHRDLHEHAESKAEVNPCRSLHLVSVPCQDFLNDGCGTHRTDEIRHVDFHDGDIAEYKKEANEGDHVRGKP